jgi:hypothetical protein
MHLAIVEAPSTWSTLPLWQHIIFTICMSFITAYFTTRVTVSNQRKLSILEEVKRLVRELQECTSETTNQVAMHLMGSPENAMPLKESKRVIIGKIKLAGLKLGGITTYLPEQEKDKLEKEFLNWKATVSGDPFPIERKDKALESHDPRIQNLHTAQERWSQHLNSLVRECMHYKIKFWKAQADKR